MLCTTRCSRSRRGFSLAELLIVISVIGILAAIAASKLDFVRFRADSVGRAAAVDLSKAQRLAVSLQHNVRVVVDGTNRLITHADANNNNVVEANERTSVASLEGTFVWARGAAANLPAPEDPTDLTAITFRRDGTASRGGTFYLSSPGDLTCRYCRAVAIARGTGRSLRYAMIAGTWKREN